MKDKKVLYILIPLVIIIWAFIVYRVLDMSEPKDESIEAIKIDITRSGNEKPIEYTLKLDYPDPFLKGQRVRRTSTAVQITRPSSKILSGNATELEKTVDWGSIVFKGVISHSSKNELVGLLEVEGEEFLVEENQQLNELSILKVLEDSICLMKEDVLKWYGLE